jgi:hypothetical protein
MSCQVSSIMWSCGGHVICHVRLAISVIGHVVHVITCQCCHVSCVMYHRSQVIKPGPVPCVMVGGHKGHVSSCHMSCHFSCVMWSCS